MPDRQWLSESAETLLRELAASTGKTHDCDVLIVGSGYGAAVAATHLAGATPKDGGEAIRVFVLERGVEYLPGTFPSRFAELPGHVRFSGEDGAAPRGRAEGLFDVRLGSETSVLVANGLGGGSLINAAVLAEPKAAAFESGWPEGIKLETMQPFYEAVRKALGGNDFSGIGFEQPKLNALFEIGVAMGAKNRFRATLAIHPTNGHSSANVARSACLQCGDCVTGCNHGAKNSLDVTYLRQARDLGARLFCGATVHRLEPLGGDQPGWAVHAFFTDRTKGYADASPLFTIRARRVVLGAGALGSTEILLRSRKEVDATDAVGQGLSGNGDAIAVIEQLRAKTQANANEQDAPASRRIGPTINGMVFVEDKAVTRNPWLLYQEFAIPGALRRVLAEVAACTGMLQRLAQPDESAHEPDAAGDDPETCGDAALDHLIAIGMQGDDGAQAKVELVTPAAAVLTDAQLRISGAGKDVYEPQLAALSRATADRSLGGRVLPSPLWRPLPGVRLDRTLSVHPLGGCAMGDNAASAVDPFGRVRRASGGVHDDLVVLDGAIVPTALGANPALTIAALAERAMLELMERWALQRAAWADLGARAQPTWRDTSAAQPLAPTVVELRERMSGRWQLGGKACDAALTMHSEPIADLQAFVRRLPRPLGVARAELRVGSGDGGSRLTATLSGNLRVLHRAASSGASRHAAAQGRTEEWFAALMQLFGLDEAVYSHIGEVRSIDYELVVDSVSGAVPGLALQRGDRLRLAKRLAFEPGRSPWRQLSEAEAWLEGGGGTPRPLGRLALDFGDLAQQGAPLLRILAQQDQPNALADLASLALLAFRLVVKMQLPGLVTALAESLGLEPRSDDELRAGRMPGTLRWRVEDEGEFESRPERYDLGTPGSPLLLSRYRPPAPKQDATRPVLLIHGLGASGSTFAHWSIAPAGEASARAGGTSLAASLLAGGREVWIVELRTSIAHPKPPAPWRIEDVAHGDIARAIDKVLAETQAARQVDVVAHCIGAAMFCMAVLAAPEAAPLHPKIGAVVLSQVGPLLRLGAMNRLRGLMASYLRQFISAQVFDVRPPLEDEPRRMAQALLDALLATFPYPDGDRERERARDVPGFATIRHRADAIWGRLMTLDNVGDDTLARLDEIYGWVSVQTLAQTIHFARHSLLTDAVGANRFVAQRNLAERFAFPVLLLHGRDNAMFDWQGSYDSLRLLKLACGDDDVPAETAPAVLPFDADNTWPPRARAGVLGGDTPRRLIVIDGYGHQDCLIGRNAQHDVFPRIAAFLDHFASASRGKGKTPPDPPPIADAPWLGPMLGWLRRGEALDRLHCRIVLRASPARFDTLGVAFVPARLDSGRWLLDFDHAVVRAPLPPRWPCAPIDVTLDIAALPQHDGFAVLTLHDDLPRRIEDKDRDDASARVLGGRVAGGLFVEPRASPSDEAAKALRGAAGQLRERIDTTIVRLTPALLAGADGAKADSLAFALASCQYPAGLLDREAAQASYRALAERLDAGTAPAPQWLLMVGDQIYADETAGLFDPAGGAGDFARSYERNFRLPALRAVTRRLPTLAMLDDHEVRDDWEPRQPDLRPLLKNALAAFEHYQLVLAPDGVKRAPYRYRLAPAGFPMFVLDTRSKRQARSLRPGARGTPLDRAHMVPDALIGHIDAWLAAAGRDRPLFIVSPSLVFPFDRRALRGSEADRLRVDAWSGFPASLVALFKCIAAHGPRELIFLSGDAHLSLVSSLSFSIDDGAPLTLHSIVSSGTYTPWPFADTAPQDLLLDGEVRYRVDGVERIIGTIETPAVVRSAGVALVEVRRAEDGVRWRLGVEFERAGERVICSRVLADGEAWRVQRLQRSTDGG